MELPDELLYGARVSVWSRWFLLVFGLLEVNYRVDYWGTGHILNSLYLLAAMSVNGYVHYRIHSGRPINIYWLLGLSVQDLVMTSFSTALSGGFDSRYAVFYYHSIAVVALVFASMPLTLIAVTVVATVYTALCLLVEPGLSFQMQEEKALLYRVIGMYGVGVVVSLITRYERMRRLAAVDREVRRERVEISQTIHDTTAQSAFMVGIGIETALQLADKSNEELRANLMATSEFSKSAMWELRHPIDSGLISKGQELGSVLRAHANVFSTITSIPVEVSRSGVEQDLSVNARQLLFSIAHNALTNVFRHAQASKVALTLDFEGETLAMSVSDDGVGLPDNYAESGHGFANMRTDAERLGGRLEVESNEIGGGTTVRCVVPYLSQGSR